MSNGRTSGPSPRSSSAIRPLGPDDISAYTVYEVAMRALSGRVELHHGPYPMGEPVPDDFEHKVRSRMLAAVGTGDWRRYWGAFDGQDLVGLAYVGHTGLLSESHRCDLGLGVLPSHRRRGLARGLLRAAVAWCRSEPTLEWLDLGVFGQNEGAIELYTSEGFIEIGRTPDRFRVDGIRIEDISMTLSVD